MDIHHQLLSNFVTKKLLAGCVHPLMWYVERTKPNTNTPSMSRSDKLKDALLQSSQRMSVCVCVCVCVCTCVCAIFASCIVRIRSVDMMKQRKKPEAS